MLLKSLIITTALATYATTAFSQNAGDFAVGLGATNFGLSLEGEYTVNPQVRVRGLIMGGLTIDDEFEVDDATVDGEAEFGGFALLGDYYPLGNAWRISGGLFVSNTEITGLVDDDGLEYEGTVEFTNSVAPMIATGFSTSFADGWSVSGDLGVIISSLEVSSDEDDPVVQADIDELNDDLEDVPVYPIVGVTVSYQF
ncbi:hypothetical protein SLH49_20615 [Cognatiyoonia sp. IB215446]|uniref:hypothetical protein n=1 Tax=Cognatiyoonia sp. IB215446 TaxID=3097355 RepID=UPI002A103704|nr:hypothetical protein [Cognatiyoonia sp. IB215446]MDX8350399.1 hypothetical protein [Cognatiyoonia sp. IB215446]